MKIIAKIMYYYSVGVMALCSLNAGATLVAGEYLSTLAMVVCFGINYSCLLFWEKELNDEKEKSND